MEITALKDVADYDGIIDPAAFARETKAWFSELTEIKPIELADVVAPAFIRAAQAKYPG